MYKKFITEVPDFPIEGISFKDISPLLANEEMFGEVIVEMRNLLYTKRIPDYWIGIDARGFIFASALSILYNKGLVLMRKRGKLPPPTVSASYALEYGEDSLEMAPGSGNVIIIDDVLATGGTLRAAQKLCENAGYKVVDVGVLIDLKFLHDDDISVKSIITYE